MAYYREVNKGITKDGACLAPEASLIETEAQLRSLLQEGKVAEVSEQGAKVLKAAIQSRGRDDPQLVPMYILVSECHLLQKRYKQAEDLLSHAGWLLVKSSSSLSTAPLEDSQTRALTSRAETCFYHSQTKSPTEPSVCSCPLQRDLNLLFGRVYLEQGRYETAASHLAQSVFYSSHLHSCGPLSLFVAEPFYYMARTNLAAGKLAQAMAFFDKVVEIWHSFLNHLRLGIRSQSTNELQLSKAAEMLEKIGDVRKAQLGESHIAVGEAIFTLGLVSALLGHDEDSEHLLKAAQEIYNDQLGPEHEASLDLGKLLQMADLQTNFTATTTL